LLQISLAMPSKLQFLITLVCLVIIIITLTLTSRPTTSISRSDEHSIEEKSLRITHVQTTEKKVPDEKVSIYQPISLSI